MQSRNAQLKLVDVAAAEVLSPEQRVFDHWVWMMGKAPRRTVLGPERRKVLRRALELYDVETLMLAIEGCAGSAWHAGDNDRGTAYNDLELILRNERNVERFADMGEQLRAKALRQAQRERDAAAQGEAAEPVLGAEAAGEDAAKWRERLRALAASMAGRRTA
ncbi:MAG: Vibrio phage VvAW1 [Pseudomonadota bacterium]